MSTQRFHPAVAAWFDRTFGTATASQQRAWPAIQAGRHALIAAPTGSGKTLAAFLAAIDQLVREGIEAPLQDRTHVVYVSPLKALSNDVQRNLTLPLEGIRAQLASLGLPDPGIRALLRTGDTTASARAAMIRRPPHILVTTPESLYLLLTSESGRQLLAGTRSIIVDEIHAVVGSKRGAHLALSLERLTALCERPPQRIGLSATQKPIEDVARFLLGSAEGLDGCHIVDAGHDRPRDLSLVLPDAPLEAVMSGEVWQSVYDRLATLVREHRTTLIFANTRRMVERVTRHLAERLGEQHVAAHHGSLAKEQRLDAEQRLKAGQLQALVATASLELGIDIGDVGLVCQLGSPRSIATFLQRVGRANHAVGGVPKGRLFPLSRDELVECVALLQAVRAGELDRLHIPPQPLDVLAQQVVAEVAAREYGEDELYALVRRAWPYQALARADFDQVLRSLVEGYSTRRGRQAAYLHRDAVHGRLRARRGARLTALTCGGAIPDNADYQVVLEPTNTFVGTLNEDFAIESNAGDVFQLGNTSYRILRVEAGRVRAEDARGQPPNIPFWLGEAPARSTELSAAVSRLRAQIDAQLPVIDAEHIARSVALMMSEHALDQPAAEQVVEYLAAAKGMLGTLPTQDTLVLERFFDEAGGMQLVVHTPFGSRINRAYGLALRKRFCRQFNFELQAAATENAIVLSLGETHSFALEDVARYLHSRSVEALLTQAVLDAPLFNTRWRWTASIALAVRRARAGKKTPAPLQRMAAEDLVATVFPDQIACAENLTGEREIPDHPLVRQTLYDCLHEAMDIDGLVQLLQGLEQQRMAVIARDLPHPSPLAAEVLNAQPYAFLDDAPLEERRTQAVAQRRWLDPTTAAEFGRLDATAIEAVRAEAAPTAESADELHDALIAQGLLRAHEAEAAGWAEHFAALRAALRATPFIVDGQRFWAAAELLPQLHAAYPSASWETEVRPPSGYAARAWEPEAARLELVRGRLQVTAPTTAAALAQWLHLPLAMIEAALGALEGEGFALRGHFTPNQDTLEWCERRLLARIHHYTLRRLRAEIEPVSSAVFTRFLLEWQGITREPQGEGLQALAAVIEQLEGFELPAAAWESDVLAARLKGYDPAWLDGLCLAGRALWVRLTPPRAAALAPVRATPIVLLSRRHWPHWRAAAPQPTEDLRLSHSAAAMLSYLRAHGASFFDEIAAGSSLLPAQAEDGLAELVGSGLVGADSYSGLRALLLPLARKRRLAARGRRLALHGLAEAGRWSLIRNDSAPGASGQGESRRSDGVRSEGGDVEHIALTLLRRYGVMFRRLLTREVDWLPPWYELLRTYRRLEAQGRIRGGRFVAGITGEQFALPDAVAALRATRARAAEDRLVSLSAADPLNLVGVLAPGVRVPALAGNRVLLRDGVPIAVYVGGRTELLTPMSAAAEWAARNALLRGRMPSAVRSSRGAPPTVM